MATFGNLVHRVLSFTYRNFDEKVPTAGPLGDLEQELLRSAREAMESVDRDLHDCHFKAAIGGAFSLAQPVNRYLDARAPWHSIKTDRAAAAATLHTAITVINCLKMLLYPFLPFSAQRLHEFLGLDGTVEKQSWDFDTLIEEIEPGNPLRHPSPLYTKLDPQVVDDEVQRLGASVA